ncbi:MAG: anthranilate synthase component I [Alphaproteobacteria bacterium]
MSDFDAFQRNFDGGKTQLVTRWIPADLETPVSAYLKLCGNEPYAFLLESVEGGKTLGRYSIIGFAPDKIWQCHKGAVSIDGKPSDEDALFSLRDTIKSNHIDAYDPALPPMAVSGMFGYMGYDMVRLIEDIPDNNPDDLQIPDSILIRPSVLVIFDNVKNMICLVAPVYDRVGDARAIYDAASGRLDDVLNKLEGSVPDTLKKNGTALQTPLTVSSNMTQEQYHSAVSKAVDYIHQGEVFQVVPGQRFSVDFDLPSFALYRSLRRLNPSPFMFHLSFEGFSIVGSSPEILVRVRDNTVTIRPIAGTRKRGASVAEDNALAEELLSDPKERAEHLMLLDLGRNDVGRVAEFGSINITDEFIIERYSHVMHIVSNVEGQLRDGLDSVDALFAGFPAGTVSGAPKVRAMEIIDELEVSRRSYYGGAAGYFSGNGDLDTCIALRTALVKDGKVYVQAGGGVVADSDPEFEYQETVNKSKAIIMAAEDAIKSGIVS